MTWQKILAQGFASSKDLLSYLNIAASHSDSFAEQAFKVRVPRGFAARMQQGNPHDPLLLQVLAVAAENLPVDNYVSDPLAEAVANPLEGLIHKYQGRVLLTLTGTCAINCRYCFRRHFPYQDNNPGRRGWQPVLDYIKADTSIHEIILSGGDPLLASDAAFVDLLAQLGEISHLRTLRIHTRIPVVLPERITDSFLALFQTLTLRKVLVLHCNHANEIHEPVRIACQMLKKAGFYLLNQSVLLKGINDKATSLAELSEALFDCGVLPYYLHVLDKVAGAAHFDVPEARALQIFHQLQGLLPGYLLPRLAREEAGRASKTLLV